MFEKEMAEALKEPRIGAFSVGGRMMSRWEFENSLTGKGNGTLREAERKLRSEGHSRKEAARLAAEHQKRDSQKNIRGGDMPRSTIDDIQAAVEDFIEKHNASYTALERRLDGIEAKGNRPGFAGGATDSGPAAAHRKAFQAFLRKGNEQGLSALQIQAAVTTADDTAGGYGVPEQLDKVVGKLMADANPLRRIANVITVGTPDYKKLFSVGDADSGWVGEEEERPETGTPELAALSPFWGEIYANPAATQTSLDDLFFDVEQWLAEEVSKKFTKEEGGSFVSGNGVKKPKGYLSYATALTADATRAFGTLQHLVTGKADGFLAPTATVSPVDCLTDVVYSLKAAHRQTAVWVMAKDTLRQVRGFKDSEGRFAWQPAAAAGQPSTLLGYAVEECEDMPAVGAGSFPIAFGNWKAGYKITDRFGIRILRDPYTKKPYVLFYSTKRVGGMLEDSEAIKLLKVSV